MWAFYRVEQGWCCAREGDRNNQPVTQSARPQHGSIVSIRAIKLETVSSQNKHCDLHM